MANYLSWDRNLSKYLIILLLVFYCLCQLSRIDAHGNTSSKRIHYFTETFRFNQDLTSVLSVKSLVRAFGNGHAIGKDLGFSPTYY